MKSVVGQMVKNVPCSNSQTLQEQTLLENRPDVMELADEDLAEVTGAGGGGYYGSYRHQCYCHSYGSHSYGRGYGRGYGYRWGK